jgi:hypothetical protein
MNRIARFAMASALAASAPFALAQTSAPSSTEEPVIVETKIDLTTEPGPQLDPRAAREEAVNALAWAKTEGCRADPSPHDCIRRAQADYNAAVMRLGARR